MIKLSLILLCLGVQQILAQNDNAQNGYLDFETPNSFTYNSPLKQPDSLRSQPYFDFLSTLYRRDTEKNSLFQPYLNQNRRQRRATSEVPSIPSSELEAPHIDSHHRAKRVVIFRPLFVYRQQQVRREARRRY